MKCVEIHELVAKGWLYPLAVGLCISFWPSWCHSVFQNLKPVLLFSVHHEFREHLPLGEAHPHRGHLRLRVGPPHLHLLLLAHQCRRLRLARSTPGKKISRSGNFLPLGTFLVGNFFLLGTFPAGLFLSDQIKNAFPEARDLFRNNILRFSCDDRAWASLKFLSFSYYGFLLSSLILVSSELLLPWPLWE